MPYDSSDEQKVKEREEQDQLEVDQEYEDIKAILELPAGERFFKRIYDKVQRPSMTGNSMTFFNEGERNFAIAIWADVAKASPAKAAKIVTEIFCDEYEDERKK